MDNHKLLEDIERELSEGIASIKEISITEEEGTLISYIDVQNKVGEIVWQKISPLLSEKMKEIKKLITDEIAIAHTEGTPTARLTSLYNKF